MIVKHNMRAFNAQRMYNISVREKAGTTEKLSSGYKINRAADDAAGLSISEKMRRQIRGISQGTQNSDDGVSVCQVADGALGEVSEMLHRITELSIQAANGTYTVSERSAIQREINQILMEIDRIGDDTAFNDIPVFRGQDTILYNRDGSAGSIGDIKFDDFRLTDLDLGWTPFGSSDDADHLKLTAIVKNPDIAANGSNYNLIYGNGNTSQSSMRLSYKADGNAESLTVDLRSIASSNFKHIDNKFSRDFVYTNDKGVNIAITQTVEVDDADNDYKYYKISYAVKNQSDAGKITDLKMDFMFHADTAYNNNDRCESYFVQGKKVENACAYGKDDLKQGVIDSFSIVDVDNTLAFTEKIVFGNTRPDHMSIGQYTSVKSWGFHNSPYGGSTNRMDLGFNLVWENVLGNVSAPTFDFQYGIAALEKDDNLNGVSTSRDLRPVVSHEPDYALWIQSGGESGEGMWLVIGEMNTEALGIRDIDVSTMEGAEDAIQRGHAALENLSNNRSRIGAQQNRLEHTIANGRNAVENTTAAESRIRDTDIAKETVYNSLINILAQTGEAMMAQANKASQDVVSLLQ